MAHESYEDAVKGVWRVTLWLSILTILEVGFALMYEFNVMGIRESVPRFLLNLTFIIATLGKAFFIVAEFMHLKYERRALIISMGVPMIFLVWAIIAFLWEGVAWLHMKGFDGGLFN